MSRVKRSVPSRAWRKKVVKMASGYRHSGRYRVDLQKVQKGLVYQYRDRRVKKREFRSLWIVRLNAALRELGTKYSVFINRLNTSTLIVNRKVLADLAMNDSVAFKGIVEQIMGESLSA